MDFHALLRAVRAAWWLPLAGLLAGGSAALLVSLLETPLYSSSTQLFVSTSESTSTSDVYQGSQFSQQRVTSYAQLISGQDLAARVADRLELDVPAQQIQQQISATVVSGTVLIDVTVADADPRQAQRIAAAVGDEFTSFAEELETPAGGGASPVKVTVTDQPDVASAPSSPNTKRSVALGILLGAALGLVLAVAKSQLDRTVKESSDASDIVQAPVIGVVLKDDALAKRHVVDRSLGGRSVEDFRQLRNNLQYLNVDEPPKVIMITSALPSEGKTTAVVNLALALSDADRRVVIVEADLRKPKVTRYLGLVSGVGLTNVLAGTADIDDVIQTHGSDNLAVIAAGETPPNPGELLASSQMFALLDKLRAQYDFVLVDAPPLLPVADASGLSVYMDGVLLSVRYGSTRREQLQTATATLGRVGARTLGVIMNIVPPRAQLVSGHGYSYGYDDKTS